jgi:hypothetical protein
MGKLLIDEDSLGSVEEDPNSVEEGLLAQPQSGNSENLGGCEITHEFKFQAARSCRQKL